MTAATYQFLPWVRSGLSAAVTARDTLGPGTAGRAGLGVQVRIGRRGGPPITVSRTVEVLGPGAVVGIDRRQVLRTDPAPGVTDFEPNHLAQVEFDRPELPWLFTPAAATTGDRLRPWIALVVVEQGPGVSLGRLDGAPLPVLEITSEAAPDRQLPDLAESWAWAHAQVLVTAGEDVDGVLAGRPERTASRLLCPRRLDPGRAYLAAVVPAFEAGRRAGLGLAPSPDDEAELRPAWAPGSDPVRLPVYHSWPFATGDGGDFESLARALRPLPVPAGVGERMVFVGSAGAPLPDLDPSQPGAFVPLAGALVAPAWTPSAWPSSTAEAVAAGLRTMVDRAWSRVTGPGDDPDADPAVTPPLYGRWLAAQPTVPADPSGEPRWLATLNLDPRHRAVAALGTFLVQQEQERLMDDAWAQVGEITDANRRLRWGQVAREVRGALLQRHAARLTPGSLLHLTAPAHTRMAVGGRTVAAEIRASRVPDAVASPAFLRLSRPRGPVARRLYPPAQRVPRAIVEALDAGRLAPESPVTPDGLFDLASTTPARTGVPAGTLAKLAEARQAAAVGPPRPLAAAPLRQARIDDTVADRVGGLLRRVGPAPPRGDGGLREPVLRFRSTAVALAERLTAWVDQPSDPARPALGVDGLRARILEALDPEKTVPARLAATVRVPDGLRPRPGRDPIEPIMAAPEFTQPAWELLRDHLPAHLLPGLDAVPGDTVTLVKTNPAFVEALLVGLNHEMGRELLWREYPTDQRGSPFRRFWGSAGSDTGTAPDIPPVHRWAGDANLGGNVITGPDGQLVLLVRGRLLLHYPRTVVYAAPDRLGRPHLDDDRVKLPLFRGGLPPDVTFCGFDLTPDEARGGPAAPGWWFVFEEQPTEPRFGLDVAVRFGPDAGPVASWGDLSWGHLAPDEAALRGLSHLRATGQPPPSPATGPRWGRTSSDMAAILAQQPVRVALRAADLLPPP
jgi:hypothetical protein